MNAIQYQKIIYWDSVDCIFVVQVPELPGCMAHGSTKVEAIRNAEEVAKLWLETAAEDGKAIPEPHGRLIFA